MPGSRKNPVVIIGSRSDSYVCAVAWGLERCGIPCEIIGPFGSGDGLRVSLTVERLNNRPLILFDGEPLEASAVWFRKRQLPELSETVFTPDRGFIESEIWSFYNDILFSLNASTALRVNDLIAADRNERKSEALRAARKAGFLVPTTRFSQNFSDIKKFALDHCSVVAKPFTYHEWKKQASGEFYLAHAEELSAELIISSHDSVCICPAIYQEKIRKKLDIRITSIGEEIYAMFIKSNKSLDWRLSIKTGDYETEIFYDKLLYDKIRKFMRISALLYSCIDIAIDINDNIYFLDSNAFGQCLFLEELHENLNVVQSMVRLLAAGRCDKTTLAGINYRSFLETQPNQTPSSDISNAARKASPFTTIESA